MGYTQDYVRLLTTDAALRARNLREVAQYAGEAELMRGNAWAGLGNTLGQVAAQTTGAIMQGRQQQQAADQQKQVSEAFRIYGEDPADREQLLGQIASVDGVKAYQMRGEFAASDKKVQEETRAKQLAFVKESIPFIKPMLEKATESAENWSQYYPLMERFVSTAGIPELAEAFAQLPKDYTVEGAQMLQSFVQSLGGEPKPIIASAGSQVLSPDGKKVLQTVPFKPDTQTFRPVNATVDGKPAVLNLSSDGKYTFPDGRPVTGKIAPIPSASSQSGSAKTGDDEMIERAAASLIANPRDLTAIKDITSLRSDQRLKLFDAIKRRDPNYNVGAIERRVRFLDDYERSTGRAAMNRQSMNNILMHTFDLKKVSDKYARNDVRLVNTALNTLRKQHDDVYQEFATTAAVLRDEIGLYFSVYAPTVDQKKTWDAILNEDITPKQMLKFADTIIHVGLRRASTHNSDFKAVMGFDDPNMLTPDAVAAGVALGKGEDMQRFGSGGQLFPAATASTPTATAAPKEGDVMPYPGHPGKELTFKNGQWIRTK